MLLERKVLLEQKCQVPAAMIMELPHEANFLLQSWGTVHGLEDGQHLSAGAECNRVCSYETVSMCHGKRSAFSSAVCHLIVGHQAG